MKVGITGICSAVFLLAVGFGIATTLPVWPFIPYVRSGNDYVRAQGLPPAQLNQALAKCLLDRGWPFLSLNRRTYVELSVWKDPEIAARFTSDAVSLMVKDDPTLKLPPNYQILPHLPFDLNEAVRDPDQVNEVRSPLP